MNQQDIKNLEKELWDAADELRGNSKLTAGEYKDPLLGLVLLRFAQNRYEDTKIVVEENLPRRLQDVLFPDGLHYSPKTKEYRTSNIHILLEITGCFIDTWTSEKNKTRRQNVFGSRVVDILEKRSKV